MSKKDPDHGRSVAAARKKRLYEALLDDMYAARGPFRGYHWKDHPWNSFPQDGTWDSRLMARQRKNKCYEPCQLDHGTGRRMEHAVRKKG